MGLSPTDGNTVFHTVVDNFSKMAHLVPPSKLLLANETAQLVLHHLYGLPVDMVANRGSQFLSVFWKELCNLIGATTCLSSGYHPQCNGQSDRMNQEMETALGCMVSKNLSSWSKLPL